MNKILICVIFYNNFEEVQKFIDELDNQEKSDQLILSICVNKDDSLSSKKLKSQKIALEIHNPNDNLGYLNGLFFAYSNLNSNKNNIKWVIFSNTDIEILDEKFMINLNCLKIDPIYQCIAPSIIEKNKRVYENPQYKIRYSLNSINRRIFIFSHPIIANMYIFMSDIKRKLIKSKKQESCDVYSAHGAFFILDINFLESINRHYYSLMYSEEAFIAEEIRLLNKKIRYESSLEVIHNESQTTGLLKKSNKFKLMEESLVNIRDHYFWENK